MIALGAEITRLRVCSIWTLQSTKYNNWGIRKQPEMRWAWAPCDSSLWRRASYINHCMVAAHWESIADQAEQTGLSSSHQGTGNLLLGSQKDRQAHGEGPQIDLQFKLSFSGRRLWIWFDRQEVQKKSQWSCFRLSHSLVLLLLHLAILCIIIIICPSDMRFSVMSIYDP